MTEMTEIHASLPSPLEELAEEAQFYSQRAIKSILQLGRVLSEAKKLVPHGQWTAWISENAGCSERTAQQFMQAYKRFGENESMAHITDKSKLFRLLSLPAGTEEDFLETHDINEMTARQVEAAVRNVRKEYETSLANATAARHAAENELNELKKREPEIPENVMETIHALEAENKSQKDEISRLSTLGRDVMEERNAIRRENIALERDLADREEMLKEVQASHDQMQKDLLNLQSTIARGDAERVPTDELTLEVFSAAVRQFIGTCARLPHMAKRFARMSAQELESYDELLITMENFLYDGRKAINTLYAEGSIDNG